MDWAQEIRKYPIVWLAANNLTLTVLERLEGRVANMQRRLDAAVEARDQEIVRKAEIQAAREDSEGSHQQRRRNREANDAAQDSIEEDPGVGGLFNAEE